MLSKYDVEEPVASVYWNHAYPTMQAQSMYWHCIAQNIWFMCAHVKYRYIIYRILALELVAGAPYEHDYYD